MLREVVSLVLDIGIGLVAFNLARKANSREDKTEQTLADHDRRLKALEK